MLFHLIGRFVAAKCCDVITYLGVCMRLQGLLLTGVMVFGGAVGSGHAQDTLNFSWALNVGPMNPHVTAPNQMFAQTMIYESLVKYQPDGSIAPWLAQSWGISEDGKTYTFQLRQDVTFSNGEVFDAAAVKANFDAILTNAERLAWLELINRIADTSVVDSFTFQLTLNEPYYPTLYDLALPRPFRFLAPSQIPETGSTAGGVIAPVGTGPFVLAESVLGVSDTFSRNESYWGDPAGYDRVVVKVVPDANTRSIAFDTGEIDLIYGTEGQISPDTFERYRQMGTYQVAVSEPLATRTLSVNSNRPLLGDLLVRKAIGHAIDKDALVNSVLYGTQTRADTLFAPNVPYTDVGLTPYGFDRDEASRLLDEAGWTETDGRMRSKDGVALGLDLAFIGTDATQKSIAEIIQADLRTVGIAVNLIGEERTGHYDRLKNGQYDLTFADSYGAPYDPHAYIATWRVPTGADYQSQLGLENKAEIDEKITAVLNTIDEEERQALYTDILTEIHEQAVYVPLTYISAIAVAKPDVGNLSFGATVNEFDFFKLQPAQ